MSPIVLTFISGKTLTVYADDPKSFCSSIIEAQPPEIIDLSSRENGLRDHPNLQEVTLTLGSGAIILCNVSKNDMPKAQHIKEIVDCNTNNVIAYGIMLKEETDLDERFAAMRQVINNLPDTDTRLHLHRQYLKRKRAYVSALEALVDGIIRRPKE